MVKLIVTDVDGVIVGHRKGINFPYPNQKIIAALKRVRKKGIPIVLCSSKYKSAIEPIIWEADLKNPHITDSGSLIIDPIAKKIVHQFILAGDLIAEILKTCFENKIYTEIFSIDNYYIQRDQLSDITPRRTLILQKDPVILNSALKEIPGKIIKLLAIARNARERKKIDSIFKKYKKQANFLWNMHPSAKPFEYCLITPNGASKPSAVKEIVQKLKISFENVLGVGDTMGDWEFMKHCSYAATVEDAPVDVKEAVKSKEDGKYFIAPSVDKNGFLDILNYFL